jgi:hypothetical protein
MWDKIVAVLTMNWSFLAVALILGLTGEVIKAVVIGDDKEEAKKVAWKALFIKTLPIHPVIVGGLLGLVLVSLLPEFVGITTIASILYYALAGLFSSWVYNAIKSLFPDAIKFARQKLGVTTTTTSSSVSTSVSSKETVVEEKEEE